MIVDDMTNVCNVVQPLKVVSLIVRSVLSKTIVAWQEGDDDSTLEKRLATSARMKISLKLDIS